MVSAYIYYWGARNFTQCRSMLPQRPTKPLASSNSQALGPTNPLKWFFALCLKTSWNLAFSSSFHLSFQSQGSPECLYCSKPTSPPSPSRPSWSTLSETAFTKGQSLPSWQLPGPRTLSQGWPCPSSSPLSSPTSHSALRINNAYNCLFARQSWLYILPFIKS